MTSDRISGSSLAGVAIAYTCKRVVLNFHRFVEDSSFGSIAAKSCAKVYEEDSLMVWPSLESCFPRHRDYW